MTIAGSLFVRRNWTRPTYRVRDCCRPPHGGGKGAKRESYATKMAEQGFVTLSVDLAYWGGSGGMPRNAVSPDLYAGQTFSAAVDYLGTRRSSTSRRLVRSACAAAAALSSAHKDRPAHESHRDGQHVRHGRCEPHALKRLTDPSATKYILVEAAGQRYIEFTAAQPSTPSGTVHELLRTPAPSSASSTTSSRLFEGRTCPRANRRCWNHASNAEQQYQSSRAVTRINEIETISTASDAFNHGDRSASRASFSEDAFKRAAEPKELHWIPGAGHVDLYDRVTIIPWTSSRRSSASTWGSAWRCRRVR